MTDWRDEWRALAFMAGAFTAALIVPAGVPRFQTGLTEAFELVRWYAREHVVLCLVPAFFIAGAIGVFISQTSVLRFLGPDAPKPLAYGIASVSGTILAACSCTVLPLFAGIHRSGAGIGPATAFLYSGPAINVLAIVLTARVLGAELGTARAVGAVTFSVIIGLLMQRLFRGGEPRRGPVLPKAQPEEAQRPLWQVASYFTAMIAVLVFANWGDTAGEGGLLASIRSIRWHLTVAAAVALGLALATWFSLAWRRLAVVAGVTVMAALISRGDARVPFGVAALALGATLSRDEGELGEWFASSWAFAKQILPLLLMGVLLAGAFLGRPGHGGWLPSRWVEVAVGGNSLAANLFAALAGALMYFATLTEVPIVQGLMGSGMGEGPALALLLAGPALSLPSLLVLRKMIGWKITLAYAGLVVVMATIAGAAFGWLVN